MADIGNAPFGQAMSERTELEALLREPITSAVNREQVSFDTLTSPFSDNLVLFGAGGLGQKTLAGLRNLGVEPLAFADNNSSLWCKRVEGVPILSPQDAAREFGHNAAFVVTIWRAGGTHRFGNTRQQLIDLGCMRVVSFAHLFWKYPHIFLPYYAIGLPHLILPQFEEIVQAFALWEDDASRNEFMAQIRLRLKLDFDGLPSPVTHDQYFPDDLFALIENEVFLDCGAYDGDSLDIFFKKQPLFKGKFIAIEPDPYNLKSLQERISSLPPHQREHVITLPYALGVQKGIVRFAATGLPSAGINSDGPYEVESMPLDEIAGDISPTFIKMDIEGAEFDALSGCRASIMKNLPVLAISVYHRPDDLWRIPLLIQSFSSEYRFFLRPHNEEGWDLICYAVPCKRLKITCSERHI